MYSQQLEFVGPAADLVEFFKELRYPSLNHETCKWALEINSLLPN